MITYPAVVSQMASLILNNMNATRSSSSNKSTDSEAAHAFTSELEQEFNITHDDLERAYEDFVTQGQQETPAKDKKGVQVASVIAGGVGVVMLVMMLQMAGLEIGPELSFTQHLAVPLVVLLSGLLLWSRRRSKKQTADRQKWEEAHIPDFKIGRKKPSGSREERRQTGSKQDPSENYDAYAFRKKKRLFRTRRDRKFLGVCGGIANYFGFDPTIVRIIFALSTAFYGSTILVYLVLGVVLPKMPEKES